MFLLFESSFDADSLCDSSWFNIEIPTRDSYYASQPSPGLFYIIFQVYTHIECDSNQLKPG